MRKLVVTGIIISLTLIAITWTSVYAQTETIGSIEYFYTSSCGSCREQAPIWDKWIKGSGGKLLQVTLEKIDIVASQPKALSRGYKEQGIPYFQVRNKHGDIIATGQGVQSEKQLTELSDLLFKAADEIEFISGKQFYIKDGKQVKTSSAAFIQKGRTYVPLRPLGNSLGIDNKNITYDDGVITLKKGEQTVVLKVGQETIKIAGVLKEIDVAPVMNKGSVFLPAKYIAEAFGYEVNWRDGKVIISKPVDKIFSKSIPDPTPAVIEGDDKYYDLAEMLKLGGLDKEDFYFEKENVIILNGNAIYTGLVLTDAANKIYLVGKDGKYYNYDLGNTLTKRDDKWLVKNDDVLRIGMLGSILKG